MSSGESPHYDHSRLLELAAMRMPFGKYVGPLDF